jgi:hypothetical protein
VAEADPAGLLAHLGAMSATGPSADLRHTAPSGALFVAQVRRSSLLP